jgi:hypothetical protein
MGRDKAYRVLKDLMETGYIHRFEKRNEAGQMTGIEYHIYDVSCSPEPYPEKPFPENPDTANQHAYKDLEPVIPKDTKTQKETRAQTRACRPFDDFWNLYPQKVGKRAAFTAFEKAMKRADFETIMAGLQRYVAKADDRPWCNPATWLNQDRWEDQPAQSTSPPVSRSPVVEAAKKILRERQNEPEQHNFDNGHAQRLPAEPNGHGNVVTLAGTGFEPQTGYRPGYSGNGAKVPGR